MFRNTIQIHWRVWLPWDLSICFLLYFIRIYFSFPCSEYSAFKIGSFSLLTFVRSVTWLRLFYYIDWYYSVLRRIGNISAILRRRLIINGDHLWNFEVSLAALSSLDYFIKIIVNLFSKYNIIYSLRLQTRRRLWIACYSCKYRNCWSIRATNKSI